MQVIMGIAPSRHSARKRGVSAPWCKDALSGEKVRLLADSKRLRFANASNTYPGSYTNKKGKEVDRTPWVSTGFERLLRFADRASANAPVDILLLGCAYWGRVIGMAANKKMLAANQTIEIASPLAFRNSFGAVAANLFLFPHPYFWPDPKNHNPTTYRSRTKEVLAALTKPPFDSLGDDAIETVFSRFGLGGTLAASEMAHPVE